MRDHKHCKCGEVIRHSWFDWTDRFWSWGVMFNKCYNCRRIFIDQAVYASCYPNEVKSQAYFDSFKKEPKHG
jgi:hypothetical protein